MRVEHIVLREMRIKKKPDELSAETRKDLQQFCVKWADVFKDLNVLAF